MADGPALRFTFTCQRCGSTLEGHSGLSRRPGRCPTCAAVFIVPQVDRRTGLPTGPAEVADDGSLPTPMHAYAAAGDKAPSIRRRADGSQVIVCPRCDLESGVEEDVCSRCGLPFTIEGATSISHYTPGARDHLADLSLVLGIIGLPAICLPVPIPGALAVMLGLRALLRASERPDRRRTRWTAAAGILLGAASIALGVLIHLR